MTTFIEQQLYEIRVSARSIAEEEIANRGITDPDVVDFLARYLFIMRDGWASFDEDADTDTSLPIIDAFFGENR
ncbi:hypothetical protein [Subtercola sp. Z020]|uniref:hypothetical protein n=1 Tax=Subtercola sp. Z020 TaxID=2080582 RepID=UPI0011B06744|nr:hypothetical protein [Subtercola sp. Z020]